MAEQEVLKQSRKRPLEVDIRNTPFYKMHTLIKDLRPHFIEVLKTPDFRNCKSADEIRQGMKLLTELCRQMKSECVKLEKCSSMPSATDHQQGMKPTINSPRNIESTEVSVQGTFIIGGSAIGWNFITYSGGNPLYYGRTKEAFRALNPKSVE